MKNSKLLRRLWAIMLVLSFLTASFASLAAHPMQVQAAPSLTMYPGDSLHVWVDSALKCDSIKSSNRKVADLTEDAKKNTGVTSILYLDAKKPGKTTISAKKTNGPNRNVKLNIVVKKLDFTTELLSFKDNTRFVLSVKNNMDVSFDGGEAEIEFKDKNGKLIKKGSASLITAPLAGKTTYNVISPGSPYINIPIADRKRIDVSRCTVKITSIRRSYNPQDVVKDVGSKLRRQTRSWRSTTVRFGSTVRLRIHQRRR